ncbi:MAG: M16 family metallopeptidase [Chloroflexota bacterium]
MAPTTQSSLPVESAVLPNGLTVLLREDHAAPVAAFYVFYKVGSRNEVAGTTGLSHWVEHLLFDGTPTFPKGALHRVVAANGGYRNGFTWMDGTAFFEALPADRIELSLKLECDRMVNAVLDPAEVERERTVIISERQGGENYPTRHLYEEVMAVAYKVHPYGQPVIGWKSDLERITREELWTHYQCYYHPNNAVAVAVGDFSAPTMLAQIEHYFGGIAAGQSAAALRSVEPPQEGERRVEVRRPGGTAHLMAVYHIPAAGHQDIPALSVVDALLSGGTALGRGGGGMGRSSRLRRVLVDTGKASSVSASTGTSVDPGLFYLSASLRPGTEPQEVERILFDELQRLSSEHVDEQELLSASEQAAAQFLYAAEGVSRQASALGQSVLTGLPTDDRELLQRLRSVSPEEIRSVCARYFAPENRTLGWFRPTEAAPVAVTIPQVGPAATPATESPRPAPTIQRQPAAGFTIRRAVLSNGIVVLLHAAPGTPWELVQASVPGGSAYDADDQRGVAAAQGALRLRGTERRSYEQISEESDRRGIQLHGGSGDYFSSYSVKSLLDHLDVALDLLTDVFRQPVYPDTQLDIVRGPMLAAAREEATNTREVAERRFRELAYPVGHPYHRWPTGTTAMIEAISRDDVTRFAERFAGSAGMVIAMAGGLDGDRALEYLERYFGAWPALRAAPDIAIPPVNAVPAVQRGFQGVAGKTQTDLVIGLPGIVRNDPDYFRLLVADTILGRLGMGGRVGEEVRERRGLAYYASTSFDAGFGPGPWAARIGVAPKDVEAAVEATLGEFRRYREDGPTDSELAEAKQLLTGSMPLRLETTAGVASLLMSIQRFGLPLDEVDHFIASVNAVKAGDVLDTVRRHLDLDRVVVSSAGPEAT